MSTNTESLLTANWFE